MKNDIAVIGIAGRFPGAENLREFYQNLVSARDCVVEIPARRFCDSNFPIREERYQVMGLLDQVDRFDRKFFGISPREAQQMDPHQRLTLEVAYEALEDSGHSPASFAGAEMAVIVANADYSYRERIPELEPSMYSGNAQFSVAGRLARFFNTTGPAFIVDTGCSSGLMGVSLACDQIALGQASLALVAGARIVIDSLPVVPDVDLGITSNDGKTRSFNADSNGSGSSEAVVAVLLKPLAQAIQDRDHVYAVIASTAVNASAQSSASLTATSSAAQSALLEKAWQRAGLDPSTIGFIEAHGSGTKLGDPIEINGIDTAFRRFTDRKHFCAVSSVKSNIGHTDKVAGLCGLVKAALALKHKQLFAALHFDRPNPLIDFANSATYINTELKPWPVPAGEPRRAGVSSFGFAGNNVHVVLEEFDAPAPASSERPGASEYQLVTVSSKRADGVGANLAALSSHLENEPSTSLEDVAFTLNLGRDHFRHRAAFVARDTSDLLAQLHARAAAGLGDSPTDDAQVVLAFSDDSEWPEAMLAGLAAYYPVFARALAACHAALGATPPGAAFRQFAAQYSLHRLLEESGVPVANVVGLETGDLAAQAALGDLTLAEAVATVEETGDAEFDDLEGRLRSLIARQADSGRIAFVEMGAGGRLSRTLRQMNPHAADESFAVFAPDPQVADSLLDLLKQLYTAGARLDFPTLLRHSAGRRISLPGYQFERIRCWYAAPHPQEAYNDWRRRVYADASNAPAALSHPTPFSSSPVVPKLTVDGSWSETEQEVARIWMEVLRLETVGLDDDFFSLGGHSLFGSMVRNRIERTFGLKLEFKDIFAQSRIRTLARCIDRQRAEGAAAVSEFAIPIVRAAAHYAVSPAQFRLWVLDQKEGAMRQAYNVTIVLRLRGPLDADRLATAVEKLVARHEALRTHFIEIEGEPRQVVNADVAFAVARTDADEESLPEKIDGFVRPFDLGSAPLFRALLLRLDRASHVLALDIHHTLFDGSSYGILLRDLALFYSGQTPPEIGRSYKDYAAWRTASLDREPMREAEAYWLELFQRAPRPLELPTDFPRPAVRSFDGAVREAKIEPTDLLRLRGVAQQGNATLFMTLLAAYSILLSKYSGHRDIVVGSSVAGRTHADLEPIVGLFVNTVAFRTEPRGDLSFREYLAEVREHCFASYKHQDYPFESLVRKLGHTPDRSRNPLFDTMLVLQNMDLGGTDFVDGIALTPGEFVRRSAKFDLTLEFYEHSGTLHFNLEYCAALFKPATVDRIARDLVVLLRAVCANPAVPIRDITLESQSAAAEPVDSDFTFATL